MTKHKCACSKTEDKLTKIKALSSQEGRWTVCAKLLLVPLEEISLLRSLNSSASGQGLKMKHDMYKLSLNQLGSSSSELQAVIL